MKVARVEVGFVGDGALVEFYRDVFGLDEIEPRSFPIGTLRRLAAGPSILKFLVPADPPAVAPVQTGPFWHRRGLQFFALWLDTLEGLSSSIVARGGTVVQGVTEIRPGVYSLLATDPDGNTVEVMSEAGSASADSPRRVGG